MRPPLSWPIPRRRSQAFTLVELLVATTVLAVIMTIVLGITGVVSEGVKKSSGNVTAFRAARAAFDGMTRQLSEATLNNYYDYKYDASGNPASYSRTSDLHFICGKALIAGPITHSLFFTSPVGYKAADPAYENLDGLLNACGYFIQYGKEANRPGFLTTPDSYRFRLMQFLQPAQNLAVYDASGAANKWFRTPLDSAAPPTHAVADNIIALIVNPQSSTADAQKAGAQLTTDFEYDTRTSTNPLIRHQLPPLVEVIMVAIDEPSAKHLGNSPTPPDFGLAGLFTNSDPVQLNQDLGKLELALRDRHITYRIFRSIIPIRGSKWTAS